MAFHGLGGPAEAPKLARVRKGRVIIVFLLCCARFSGESTALITRRVRPLRVLLNC